MLQRHGFHDDFTKSFQLDFIWKHSGENQVCRFLESRAIFSLKTMNQVFHIHSSIIQFTRNRFQCAVRLFLVTNHIANTGKANQNTRPVFIAQSALDIHSCEQILIDVGCLFDGFRQSIY